jgi:hypothetical protein
VQALRQPESIALSVRPSLKPDERVRTFRLRALLGYQPTERAWKKVPNPQPQLRSIRREPATRQIARLPVEAPRLYAVCWEESGHHYVNLVPIGPILCNDVMLGPAPTVGLVAACVPFDDHAVASFVPDPAPLCK